VKEVYSSIIKGGISPIYSVTRWVKEVYSSIIKQGFSSVYNPYGLTDVSKSSKLKLAIIDIHIYKL